MPHWKTWNVPGSGYLSHATSWCAHPYPELECKTQHELVAAISEAIKGNPTLHVLTKAAGPAVVPSKPFQAIPARPSLTLLDQERDKLAGLHPAWQVWFGIRQLASDHLEITWRARPQPTISGSTSPGDLAARIDQVMSNAYIASKEAEPARWSPRDSSSMRID
jgi:hypothetical protein